MREMRFARCRHARSRLGSLRRRARLRSRCRTLLRSGRRRGRACRGRGPRNNRRLRLHRGARRCRGGARRRCGRAAGPARLRARHGGGQRIGHRCGRQRRRSQRRERRCSRERVGRYESLDHRLHRARSSACNGVRAHMRCRRIVRRPVSPARLYAGRSNSHLGRGRVLRRSWRPGVQRACLHARSSRPRPGRLRRRVLTLRRASGRTPLSFGRCDALDHRLRGSRRDRPAAVGSRGRGDLLRALPSPVRCARMRRRALTVRGVSDRTCMGFGGCDALDYRLRGSRRDRPGAVGSRRRGDLLRVPSSPIGCGRN